MIKIEEIKKKYGIEIALILLVCRVYFKTGTLSHLDIFIKDNIIDWTQFLRSSELHGIRPIVYKTILNTDIPIAIRDIIRNQLLSISVKNWNFTFETERLIVLLKSKNIVAAPYKGSSFSKEFYGDFTSRESNDIDLFIRKEDIPIIIDLMESEGYLADDSVYNYLGSKFFENYKDLCFNKYKNRSRQFHVEFHWAIAEPHIIPYQKLEKLLQVSENKIILLKEAINPLNTNAHFISILINHVLRDVFKDLKALIDMAICIQDRFGLLNYKEINTQIENLKLNNSFHLTLLLSEQLLGIQNINYSPTIVPKNYTFQFKKNLMRKNPTGWVYIRSRDYISCQLILRDRSFDKISFLVNFFWHCLYPTDQDFSIVRLPKSLFFIYFLIKPIRSFFIRSNLSESKKKLMPIE